MSVKIEHPTYSFDHGASFYLGCVFEEVNKTLTVGTCPGCHDAIVVWESEDDETDSIYD